MIVLSWDIGLKNLSYCIMTTNSDEYSKDIDNYSIIDWDIINLYFEENKKKCSGLIKKTNSICGKNAKIINNNQYYCKKHSPKNSDSKLFKIKKKKNKNPFEYALRIKQELDKRPFLLNSTVVLLENQPALVNPIMKTVQIILLSYFSFKNTDERKIFVKNVNARMKEKLPVKDERWGESKEKLTYENKIANISQKNKYTRRKKLCYYYSLMRLQNSPTMKDFLLQHKKKDDLTDSYLMCVDFLHKNF